ncbi:peptide deformylase [Staphylococcus pseudoxylosus]|uniref:Peptide deformylase n=2 Tax=Staphylococcus pseudoxylosus TaxID=2282419 RepID=A0AAQ0MG80_9STAP|nr:peptide deformylase [Staphylococcus pseudoxylosus]RMI83823.1 hypothetical protein D9V42_14355 [Staphylococcus pseudoxylosus]
MKDIVKEDNEMLYKKTKPLEIPLSDNDFTLLNNMMIFLKNSQNLYGEEKILKLKGHASIVAQHEIDHLNGIMFFERIDKINPLAPPNNANSIY